MAFDFKLNTLLPKIMQAVPRWTELIDVVEEVVDEFKVDNIDILINQLDLDNMSITDCKNLSVKLGYNIPNFDGYTNSLTYFKKQIETLTARVKNKVTLPGYLLCLYIYYLKGNAYPVYVNNDGIVPLGLTPFYTWQTSSEIQEIVTTLDYGGPNILYYYPWNESMGIVADTGQTYDMTIPIYGPNLNETYTNVTLDDDRVFTLDGSSVLDKIIRGILINYKFLLAETANYFHTSNTSKAFYIDTQNNKRISEKIYYEPILDITYNISGLVTTTNYTCMDLVTTTTQQTIFMGGDTQFYSGLTSIHLGNGGHGVVDSSIIDVTNTVYTFTSGEIIVDDVDSTKIIRRKLETTSQHLPDFSEVALFTGSGCILYSKFPMITYDSAMTNNIRFDLLTV